MTGILIRADLNSAVSGYRPLTELGQAVSNGTQKIASNVEGLRNSPSPGSVAFAAATTPKERQLSEQIFDALAAVKVLTSQVAMHFDTKWRHKVFRQLDSLHEISEWEAGDLPLQQASFATFLRVMFKLRPERQPGLGLTHSGLLIAAWTTGSDRLTVEFLAENRVRWVLSRRIDGAMERFAGDVDSGRLANSLKPYDPDHWFTHAAEVPRSA
jgi:hypothetical protein